MARLYVDMPQRPLHILWADDEIELLKPHILFLRGKGYDVTTANNGRDALAVVSDAGADIDLVILDENMPGLTGLETLSRIKEIAPLLPVIMITKSEEENIMDQAVGNKIADYLIKPVNPSQILLSIKKILHSGDLISRQTTDSYRQQFPEISDAINCAASLADWTEIYRRLTRRELELADSATDMIEMLQLQKNDANSEFFKHVRRNYESWLDPDDPDAPLMSHRIMRDRVIPLLRSGEKPFLVVIDNFRLDQWEAVKPLLADFFSFDESLYCSILPTATQYARNALFSGLMLVEIERLFPDLWVDEDSEEGKNLNESPLIESLLKRFRLDSSVRFTYNKLNDTPACETLIRNFNSLLDADLNVIVINFIDMLSHARTESRMIRELASSNAAYRSLTESWFRHSAAIELFRRMALTGRRVILTTDHGTIRVENPVKVVGDRNTNTALRYKLGKTLSYPARQVYEVRDPRRFGLPAPNLSTTYIMAGNRDFFAYPNNYNYYVQYYTGTFQHGGISLEEMLVPLISLSPKS